jgi:hypothetical protein
MRFKLTREQIDCLANAQQLCNDCAEIEQRQCGGLAAIARHIAVNVVQIRSDCAEISAAIVRVENTQRLRSDCAAIWHRLHGNFTAAQRMRSVLAPSANRLRSECTATVQRLREDLAAIASQFHSKAQRMRSEIWH